MKDLFTQFNDGRLSPHERQTRAIEGIWKALDGIDRSLSRIASKNMDELIANDVSESINEAINKSMVDDLMTDHPHTWDENRKRKVMDRFAERPRNYAIEDDKEMMSWLVYNWNVYCDDYHKYKKQGGPRVRVLDLMRAIGSKYSYDCQSKRLFVAKTRLRTIEQYNNREKIEVK